MFPPILLPLVAGLSTSVMSMAGALLAVSVVTLVVRWLEGFMFD